jgi:acyl dehydratase
VTEADNVLFTTLTMNTQSLHLDAAWAAETEFGERLVNSMFTLSTLVGLSVAQLTQGTIVANLGFGRCVPAPVRVGDTLYAETLIAGKRPSSSRPGQGIVEFAHTMRNQRGEVVATATRTTLMRCLPAAGGCLVTTAIVGPALLFCPGDRPERYAKAAAAADTVIVDLEDAVPRRKPRARRPRRGGGRGILDPTRTIVRVSPPRPRTSRATSRPSAGRRTRPSCWPKPRAPSISTPWPPPAPSGWSPCARRRWASSAPPRSRPTPPSSA